MPRAVDDPAALPALASPRMRGATLVAALACTGLGLALALFALIRGMASGAAATLWWLLAVATACTAAALAWTLWRQRLLVVVPPAAAAPDANLLHALPLPLIELAGDTGAPRRVQRANAEAAQWLGLPADQLAGLDCAALLARLPQDLRSMLAQRLRDPAASADARIVTPGWSVQLRPLGAGRWLLAALPQPRADDGEVPPPPPSEHESFSYTVSHDLRAPIRVVEGFTRILKEDYGRQLDRIANDHLERVLGAAARMNAMIDALLALAQISARPLARQPVDLSQLAAYVVEDLRRQAPERQVAVHLEPGLHALGDPTLLRMVLENLLGNAWKYSARTPDAQIWLERDTREGQPVFTVRDNGAGFDMRFADRLFGVFQRLHSANDFPGTGVGLASVQRIVRRHGGEIWAESAVQRGSSFYFTLPAGQR